MLWGSILKSQRYLEITDFRGKPPISWEPLLCNFLCLKLIIWLLFLLPMAHQSTLHPPCLSHRETPELHFKAGKILSTRKEAQKGVKAMESSGRPACVSWEGWRIWELFPNGNGWKGWCIWIDLPVGATNKLGWIQSVPMSVSLMRWLWPGATLCYQPRALRLNFSLCNEFSAGF